MPDNPQTYKFVPASQVTERHAMVVALEAPPNAGKTFSGMRLCKGAAEAQNKRWCVIDTEGGRTLHLRNEFDFDFVQIDPPHRPEKYLDVAQAAQRQGYGAILIDSFSNVWRGIGGVLHWMDEELEALVERQRENAQRNNWQFNEETARFKGKQSSMIRPKTAFKFMMAGLLDIKVPIVLSIRGEETYDPDAKKEIFKAHMNKGIGFDVTCRFRLKPDRKGIIDIADSDKFKMEKDHVAIFKNGEQLSEKHGAALEAWARNADFALVDVGQKQQQKPAASTAAAPVQPSADKKKLSPAEIDAGARKIVDDLLARVNACADEDAIGAITAEEKTQKQVAWLHETRPEEHKRLFDGPDGVNARRRKLRDQAKAGGETLL